MEKVMGFGGLFFRAKDPDALSRWYSEHLGVAPIPMDDDMQPWRPEGGPTAFAPFPSDTDYFGRTEQMWMINFRVRDLDSMVAQLRNSGIEVKIDETPYPQGRFARVYDPEGNPIELWEPAAE
jgi:glyoxylase I family protein